MYWNNLFITFSLVKIYAYETMLYSIGYTDKTCYLRNLINKGSKHNVLFIKIAQSMMGYGLLSSDAVEIIKQNTHSVCVEDDEIDIILLEKIKKDYNITLLSEIHFHAGMIAVVYLGLMDDKKVVIKIKRQNIENRLIMSCEHVDFIYRIVNVFSRFSNFIKLIMLSIQSITGTAPYIISQCNFDVEIDALITTKKEIADYPLILQNIVIPSVYNKPADVENVNFIVMEYLEGEFSNDVAIDKRTAYLEKIMKYSILMGWFFTYYHTDMHCGNLICMKDEKVGLIDFGMVIKMSEFSKEGLRFITEINQNRIEKQYAFKCINYICKEKTDLTLLSDTQISELNLIINEIIYNISIGCFTERDIVIAIEKFRDILKKKMIINLEMFIILISAAMLNSTLRVLSNEDTTIIDNIVQKVCMEIMD